MSKLFEQLVDNYHLLKYELLKVQEFDPSHFGFLPIYYKIMETDQQRVNAFKQAFELHDNLRDAVVCEVGIGTLPLTKLYMPYVKKAYLIENNPDLIPLIQAEIAQYDWADKVEVFYANALEVLLPEPVDFIIGELMSIYCVNEWQVQIFEHMRQFLKPKGQLFPNRIINFARFCQADFEEGRKHYPINFTRHLPMFLSQQSLVHEINLLEEVSRTVQLRFTMPVLLSGTINALFLESYVAVTEGANFTGTDSLMPPTVLRTDNELSVKAGDLVQVDLTFAYGTSLDEVSCRMALSPS